MSNVFDYYVFEGNDACPVCEKNITSECYETHGSEIYNYLLRKDISFHCAVCKELCQPHDLILHYHDMKDVCIWCKKSWSALDSKPDDVKHLIPCYREFMENAIPPIIPSTNEDYFKEEKKKIKCPICNDSLKPFSNIRLRECRHYFHIACISDWILNYNIKKCPICFKDIDIEQKVFLRKCGYFIEQTELLFFVSENEDFLTIPDMYSSCYFNVINDFYSRETCRLPPNCLNVCDSLLYSDWTFERFVRRFAHIKECGLLPTLIVSTEIRKGLNCHFNNAILGDENSLMQ